MVKLEKLSDRELALRMSKYIADPERQSGEFLKSVDDTLARLTKYYSYDYWRIIAEM